MPVHTFCTTPPAIQQQKPSSGAKKIYSTKLKMFFFHSSEIELYPISSLCHMKTKSVWCFAHLSTKIYFYHAFLYLTKSMKICHFFQLLCHIVVIVLRHILKAIWKSTRLSRHFSVIFFSSIQRYPLMFQEKCWLNFWSSNPLTFQKIILIKILGNFPLKHPF